MSLDDVMAAIPGEGESGEDIGEAEAPFHWYAKSMGLSIQTLFGTAISITASRSFVLAGQELIGMPVGLALSLAGGAVEPGSGNPIEFIATASGLEFSVEHEKILMVTLRAGDDEVNSLESHA